MSCEPLPGAPAALPDVQFTPDQAAQRFVPVAQYVIRGVENEFRAAVGWLAWQPFRPGFFLLTRGLLLRISLRVSIEMAVGQSAPWVLPLVEAAIPIVERFCQVEADRIAFAELLSLLRYPLHKMTPAVQEAIQSPPTAPVD